MSVKLKRITACIACAVYAAVLSGCESDSPYGESSSLSQSADGSSVYDSGDIESEDSEDAESSEESSQSDPEDKKDPEPEYLAYFKEFSVHTLEIEMEKWSYFTAHLYDKVYMSADIIIDGERFENSAIKTRGNSSLYSYGVNDRGEFRAPMKIKFDEYVDDRTFHGLDELVLLNVSDDRSFLREYLGYEAFRAIGGEAPYVTFFNIYTNGKLHGLYVGVEAVDKSFLSRVFNSARHNLYKADNYATLLPGMNYSTLDQKKGSVESKTDLKYLVKLLNEMPLGEKGEIEDILDIDSVLKYFAVNAVLYNWDDYAGVFCHNYFLYMNGGVFHFIPWDMNMWGEQWGPHYVASTGSRTDIFPPITGGTPPSQRPLVQKLLGVEEYYDQYLDYCEELNEWLKEIDESDYLNSLWEVLRPYANEDPTYFYAISRCDKEFDKNYYNGLAYFIHDRTAYLTKRLEQLRSQ